MKKISVILPVYNVASVLERSLDSVCGQSDENLEILLVDDGSTDGSGAICDRYAAADPRIRVIHQHNQGLGCARNTGLQYATGDYISFVDSDDFLAPTAYEQLLPALEEQDCDVCFFGHNRVRDGRTVPYDIPPEKTQYTGPSEIVGELLAGCLLGKPGSGACFTGLSAWSALYKRALIEQNGLRFRSEREILSEDIIFNLQVCAAAQTVRVYPRHLYYYVLRSDSLTGCYRESRFRDALRMDAVLKHLAAENGLEQLLREGIESCFCMNLIVCLKQEVRFEKQIGRDTVMARLREMGACERTRLCLSSGAFQVGTGRKLLRRSLQRENWLCVYQLLRGQQFLERVGKML